MTIHYYTCNGKGGVYELLGTAKGAGNTKYDEVVVYRDVSDGQLYFRNAASFAERMTLISTERTE